MIGKNQMMALLAGFLLSALCWAQDGDKKQPENQPAEPANVSPLPTTYLYYRVNRYDVWQYYGVNRYGQFRPRVNMNPFGSYYLYSGEPYFYNPVRGTQVEPHWNGTYNRLPAFMPYCED
ncbi:MAG: hypothetical protein KatS3mg105_0502 [Gemmatales bacterium]|nr:MAG: hypothetical protein KatS3mg105_0502 [Gemmatales bacterium]